MNTYQKVKKLLENYPECRNSDKDLLWKYWNTHDGYGEMTYSRWLNCTPAESITRARRAVQKHHPELQATEPIKKARLRKTKQLTWIY